MKYLLILISLTQVTPHKIPSTIKFGGITAAWAVEGGSNSSLKGWSDLDYLIHTQPQLFEKYSRGYSVKELAEVAADSYHKYKDDIAIAKDIGLDFFHFSIQWSRIFPTGHPNQVNENGIEYYKAILDELERNGIDPVITLHNRDTPAAGAHVGDFTNDVSVEAFVVYADFVFEQFGNRVKYWITFNNPYGHCKEFLGDFMSKNIPYWPSGTAEYLCGHNMLLAHAKTYRLYQKKYKDTQQGQITVGLLANWYEPISNSSDDKDAALRAHIFNFEWFAHPLRYGTYPKLMVELVDATSKQQGFVDSRLPKFTPEEQQMIKGTNDFIYVVYHGSIYVAAHKVVDFEKPTVENDARYEEVQVPRDENSVYDNNPDHFWNLLHAIYKNYPSTMAISIGYGARNDSLNDDYRVSFVESYLKKLVSAVDDGLDIQFFSVYALLDDVHFQYLLEAYWGFVEVDFGSPSRTRTLKKSAEYLKQVISNKTVT